MSWPLMYNAEPELGRPVDVGIHVMHGGSMAWLLMIRYLVC